MALSPEAVAALSNLGLVKRALKEAEQGKGPAFVEEVDGTVVGTFSDGAITKLVPQRSLKDTTCTCSAPGMCRHRVAVALGYRAWAEGNSSSAPTAEGESEAWSPGDFSDEALRATLSRGALEEATSSTKRGVLVEVTLGSKEQPIPSARLPSCTVRFLVPRELPYARCDCQVGQGCAHIALAVWGFRKAFGKADVEPARDAALSRAVELHDGGKRSRGEEAIAPLLALLEELVETGVHATREASSQAVLLCGEGLAKAGFTWLATGLEDLAWMLDRYRARSARYHPSETLALATELWARARVGQKPEGASELPRRYVLGQGEPMETALDHLRLLSLGARLDTDGRERFAEIFLADPDTAMVMVLTRSWTFPEGEAMPEGPALARRRVAGTSTLAQLAAGQLVTRVARRRANRSLVLGQSAIAQSSVTPQTGDFSALPKPLRVESLHELSVEETARPPSMLRPRVLAESMRVVRVGTVERCGFDAGMQRAVALVTDPEGTPLRVTSGFLGASPDALDVLGHALSGRMGVIRWIAGALSHDGHGFSIEPTLLVADRVVVPSVEERGGAGSLPALPKDVSARPVDPVGARLEAARSLLEEALELGLTSTPPSFDGRLERAARELMEVGARDLSERLAALGATRARRRAGEDVAVAPPFFDAAIRVALAFEAQKRLPSALEAGALSATEQALP